MARDSASHRYVFFAAPGYRAGRQPRLEHVPGVQVYAVEIPERVSGVIPRDLSVR